MERTLRRNEFIKKQARLALCRKSFYCFCRYMSPRFYKPERTYLRQFCEAMQNFIEGDRRVLIINMPPRHGKSYTASHLVEWLLGRDPTLKIMTGSYNETLSTRFSKMVRNTIQERRADSASIVYNDIFPATRIKEGDAAMNLWSLEGSDSNYLATSPGGTATGFGANLIFIDDIIKNADEAYNASAKERQWDWFTNTMLSRLEEGGKIIAIMTRWATDDLAGRLIKEMGASDIEHINFKAVQDDGTMLCDDILSRESYETKKKLMGADIWAANYQQEPIDLKDRLYSEFKEYDDVPRDATGTPIFTAVKAYVDTADTGSDYLCAIAYGVYDHMAYVLDVLFTQQAMEYTEPETAALFERNGVREVDIESNNGGRGFARNVERLLRERGNRRCRINWFTQNKNKVARILSNSTTVMRCVTFPHGWRNRWPEFYQALLHYQREGRNIHDDAPDALTGVVEKMEERARIKINPAILR